MALQKGYFKDEGLAVGIDQGEGSAATVTRIMGGAYDAGFGDINAIIQNAAISPAESPVMVYQLWNRPPFAIVTPKSTGIEKPGDFHGKILGGAQGTPTTRLFPVFAELNGVELSKVEIQNMAPNLQEPMLIRGELHGAFVFTSTSWFNLIGVGQDPANDYRWIKFEDYGMDLYGQWKDGTAFETNRYIDKFIVRGGRIVRTDVWNDSAETLLAKAGLAEAPL